MIARLCLLLLILCPVVLSAPVVAQVSQDRTNGAVPRVILGLFDSTEETSGIRGTRLHRLAEMPLNHLGLTIRYHDVNEPLPLDQSLDDVRGVLTWFATDSLVDPIAYLDWAEQMRNRGLRFVVLGDPGVQTDREGKATPLVAVNRYLQGLGIRSERDWLNLTYDVVLVEKNSPMVEFERPLSGVLPPFEQYRLASPYATPLLTARRAAETVDSQLIILGPEGGFAAGGYIVHTDPRTKQNFWHLNPFEFFRAAFATQDLPIPDTTTLAGRRIFYSHIDGDGWRNVSNIEAYREKRTLASEVILREALEAYPDLPVTVGPVVAEIDPDYVGTKETVRIAREIFALPHVEAGNHTYTHPFYWQFFEDYDRDREVSFDQQTIAGISALVERLGISGSDSGGNPEGIGDYERPRAFMRRPFDLELETKGSTAFIQSLLPEGKKVELYQWSGDTSPGPTVMKAVTDLGLPNINGGDTRFDREFPSHASVSPIGINLAEGLQIYASNSNENTYTDLWKGRYFGFLHLLRTIRNTETPKRIKPVNVYYHMYSGERPSSLNALLANLDHVRTTRAIGIFTSHFARIANGFFSTRFTELGPRRWRIENRGKLNTIRFDHATLQAVDLERSSGVLGQHHLQGSLYVALDPDTPEPVIALKADREPHRSPRATLPYLVEASWNVRGLSRQPDGISFKTSGFGAAEITWVTDWAGSADVVWISGNRTGIGQSVIEDGRFTVQLPRLDGREADVQVQLRAPEVTQ
ncbi:MAG: polysaccharide deacetylase family protein [Magnetovibrionaceae bacterium]